MPLHMINPFPKCPWAAGIKQVTINLSTDRPNLVEILKHFTNMDTLNVPILEMGKLR